MIAIPWLACIGLIVLVALSLVAIAIVVPQMRYRNAMHKHRSSSVGQIESDQQQFDTLAETFKNIFAKCISLYVRSKSYEGVDVNLHAEMVRIKRKYMPEGRMPMLKTFSYAQYVQHGISTLKYSSQLIRSKSFEVSDAIKMAVGMACRDFNFTFKGILAKTDPDENTFLKDERWAVYTSDKIEAVTQLLANRNIIENAIYCVSRTQIKSVLSSRDLITGKAFCVLACTGGSGYEALLSVDDNLKRVHDEVIQDNDNGFYYGA